jgi:hypothetical protein
VPSAFIAKESLLVSSGASLVSFTGRQRILKPSVSLLGQARSNENKLKLLVKQDVCTTSQIVADPAQQPQCRLDTKSPSDTPVTASVVTPEQDMSHWGAVANRTILSRLVSGHYSWRLCMTCVQLELAIRTFTGCTSPKVARPPCPQEED